LAALDPLERKVEQVEDACFKAGREFERLKLKYNRPHWRIWFYVEGLGLRVQQGLSRLSGGRLPEP
jgi:hypothetical protein